MRPKNISFAEVLKGKARSPQPQSKASTATLAELLERWEEYPEGDYTLYLGNFSHSFKSHHSSRMFTSKVQQQNDEEEMFDSWIQRQSAFNSNKENLYSQPKKLIPNISRPQQPKKIAMTSSNPKQYPKPSATSNMRRQASKPMINFKHLQNIGSNIQMIKSNNYEAQQAYSRQPEPEVHHAPYNNVEDDYHDEEPQSNWATYVNKNREQSEERLGKSKEEQEKEEPAPRIVVKSEQDEYRQKIHQLVEHTSNNIHLQISEIAQQMVNEDILRQSQQSIAQSIQEEEQQLLIGDSDRKVLGPKFGEEEDMFSQDYLQKARQQEQIERKRREDAKNKINDMMRGIFNKNQTKNEQDNKFNQQPVTKVLQINGEVGYSFASNPIEHSRGNQFQTNQHLAFKEERLEKQDNDDYAFCKKYVKDEPIEPNQIVQSKIQQEQEIPLPQLSYFTQDTKYDTNIGKAEEESIRLKESWKYNEPSLPSVPVSVPQYKPQQIKFNYYDAPKLSSPQVNIQSYQTNPSKDQDKNPHRKLKIYSSSKNKEGSSSSNKSSPNVGKSSHQKQQLQLPNDVKTNPFSIGNQNTLNIKSDYSSDNKQKSASSTPFEAIKEEQIMEVKEEEKKAEINYPGATYGSTKAKSIFSISSPSEDYQPTYTSKNVLPVYQFKTYNTENTNTTPSYYPNNEQAPTYAAPKTDYSTTYQYTSVYQRKDNNYSTYSATTEDKKPEQTASYGAASNKISAYTPSYALPKDCDRDNTGYLARLDLKESFTMEDNKKFDRQNLKSKNQEAPRKEAKTLLDRQLKQSLKQSVNIGASGQFTFEF